MNDVNSDYYSSDQSPTTPVVSSVPKDSFNRPCGDNMLKTMNPTPNGYNNIPNHKPKSDEQDVVKKHHESSKHSDHNKHSSDHHKDSSDHVKKKEDDPSKVKHSSSHSSKPKDSSSKDSSSKSDKEHHKEKKHHSSSHHKDKESSKSKEGKHSESSKHHSSEKKEDKVKSDSSKKEHSSSSSSGDKPKNDNFKENEKIKDSSSKESKHKGKDKHKEKHKDKSHKDKHKDKDGEHKDKSHKSKSDGEKSKEKHKDKHGDKEKHSEKDKHGEKSKEKHGDKDKHGEKKEKHSEKHKGEEKSKHSDKHDGVKVKEKHKDGEKHKHSEKHKKDKEEKVKIKTEKIEESSYSSPKQNGASLKEVKPEPMSDDDMPLQQHVDFNRSQIKRELEEESEEEKPKPKKKVKSEKKRKAGSDDEDDEDYGSKKPTKKVKKEKPATPKAKVKQEPEVASPKKRVKKEKEEEQEVWKWWEEEKHEDGIKWKTLSHNGPVFAPPYERVPKNVKFYYDGKHLPLSEQAEEVAGFYGRMLDHEYTSKEAFNTNFFKDWRKVMTPEEREIIKDLSKCNFKDFDVYYKRKSEERKNMTKEQKLEIKKENERLTAEYGFCIIDGHKQKIGNFKIEPPGLFRGRGEHPKMGMLKRRIEAENILINIGKEAKVPEPPPGHKWKEVRHDNTVSWLASWTENILGSTKYIMLNPSSKLKGEKDWQKYETARKLKSHVNRIREEYTRDFKSKEMKVRQRAVALYFIDKLALRAGNEKDEDTADTVGCCSLRVEHITLDDEKDGQEYVVSFDFLGKDSIRYVNSVPVEKRAYKNLKLFMENKQPGDDLFDRLNTSILNKYLLELMEGLTAKVFRTYNASNTLQQQLDLLTKEDMSIPEKILAYNRANREVAILCNHQRSVPKGFSKSMEALTAKIDDKKQQIKECKREIKDLKSAAKNGSSKDKILLDKKKKKLAQLEDQLKRLEIQATDREENKQIALGTSKLNYLDPRISVAWCKKWGVPIEKVYNKTQRDKFRWAIEMAGPDYKF